MAKSTHLPFRKSTLLRLLMAVTLAVCSTNFAIARQLSPDEALSRLKDSSMAKVSPNRNLRFDSQLNLLRSISLESSKEPALYLFSQNAKRVLVVSANDCAPALLGYFDNPADNTSGEQLPENLEYWLREYAAQIQYAEENPGTMKAASFDASKPAIDYLVKTKWNQDFPYNLKCPEFGGNHCVTGCVATAFAQVMNYHKWPERGRGSHSYSINYSDAGRIEYSIDFSEIEFDWEAMLNEYDDNSDQRSKDAVATLMKACGYSVDMEYTTRSSGAVTQYVVNAAHEYFDYSANAYYADRNNYSSQQWANLIYDQLSKGLPLIYSGRDGVWLNSNGHCFICDGYDGDGYFHFNWGWGGYCDGYFLLSALTPEGVGIGGAESGYNVLQGCIVNFYPSPDNIEANTGYLGAGLVFIPEHIHLYTNAIPENASLAKSELSFAIEFTSINSGKTFLLELGSVPLDDDNVYRPQHSLTYEELSSLGMTDGSYETRFVYNNNGEWSRLLYNANSPSAVMVTLNGTEITFCDQEKPCPVKATDVKFNGSNSIIKGINNELTYTATNDSDEPIYWVSLHYLVPVGQSPNSVSKSIYNTNLVLAPNETQVISLPIPSEYLSPMDNGEYYVAIEAGSNFSSTTYIYSDESVIFNLSEQAEALSDGTFIYQDLGNGNLTIIGTASGNKLSGDVTLPDEVSINGTDYAVTSMICSLTDILDTKNITSLDIRTPISEIPDNSFNSSTQLKSINLPSSLNIIGSYAFYNCKNLSCELNLPLGITTISEFAFGGCNNLTGDLIIPDGVNTIGDNAFYSCTGFNGQLIIPKSVISIGESAFADCSNLSGTLVIPSNLSSIEFGTFWRCTGFTGDLIIPESVISIGSEAFAQCSGFNGNLIIPEGVESIGADAFYRCMGLTGNLIIPESVSYLGGGAFGSCMNLTGDLIIPRNITDINSATFYGCSGLNGKIVLPPTLTHIGFEAFTFCNSLIGNLVIPESVTHIEHSAFFMCGNLTGILTIPNHVTSIDYSAFYGCYGLSGIKMTSQTAPEVGKTAFPSITICVPTTTGDTYRSAIPEYADYIFELADANMSQSLTVSDAVAVVNEVIGTPNSSFATLCADMNSDERISIVDATAIVDAVMKYNPNGALDTYSATYAPAANNHGLIIADNILPDSNGDATVGLRLDSKERLVALQADLMIADGLAIDNIVLNPALSETHSLETRLLDNSRIRVAIFSMGNAELPTDGQAIINLILHSDADCNSDLTLTNIIGASADACDYHLAYTGGANLGTTGCNVIGTENVSIFASDGELTIANAEGMEVTVSDISGRIILHFSAESDNCHRTLQPGLYIVTVNNHSPLKIRI